MKKRQVGSLLRFAELFGRKLQQRLEKILIMGTRYARGDEHLVVSGVELIIPEWGSKEGFGRGGHRHPSEHTATSGMTVLHTENFRPPIGSSPIEIVYADDLFFQNETR
jgi:hypothetical protein